MINSAGSEQLGSPPARRHTDAKNGINWPICYARKSSNMPFHEDKSDILVEIASLITDIRYQEPMG